MELDELKNAWNRQKENSGSMDFEWPQLLQQKSRGPVSELQRNFRKKFLLIVLVTTSLSIQNIFQFGNDVLMWVFIICCYTIAAYYRHRWLLLSDQQTADRPVKAHFEELVRVLENGIRWHGYALQAIALLFIILLELHPEPLFADWYGEPILLRVIVYGVFFTAIYLLRQFGMERNFSRHVKHLQQLLTQFP